MDKKILSIITIILLLSMGSTSISALNEKILINNNLETGFLTVTLNAGEIKIKESPFDGFSEIVMDEFGYTSSIGQPKLPAKTFLIGLPPEAKVINVEIIKKEQENLGCHKIEPFQYLNWDNTKIDELEENSYAKSTFPENVIEYYGVGKLGKYSYARLGFYPIIYNLDNNELLLYKSLTLKIKYSMKKDYSNEQILSQNNDKVALKTIINFPSIKSFYSDTSSKIISNYNNPNFIVITKDENVDALQSFKQWKESIGHSVKIVTTSWIYNNYNGRDEPEKIRNFIKSEYEKYFIKYVLIVGSHNSIPMRYFNIMGGDPESQYYKDRPDMIVPTDYYYCDLDQDWNKDNDEYFGEEYQDEIQNIAFSPEVFVGRIPLDSSDEIKNACNKIKDFESSNEEWKNKALLLGTILSYHNEGGMASDRTDTAILMNQIENNILKPSNYETTTMYEKEGMAPSEYDCDIPLTRENALNEWKKGYGLVSWSAHGSGTRITRRVWANDDGNLTKLPDYEEIERPTLFDNFDYLYLNEDISSIVFSCSCRNSYPEVTNNLGKTLIKNGAVGFIGATRSVYYPGNWDDVNDGGAMYIDYQFFNNLVKEGQSCGEAIHYSKYSFREKYCHSTSGGSYLTYLNIVAYNLYGDPSIFLESFRPEKPIGPTNGIPGIEYTYRTRYNCPDESQIYFWWDWGDGTNSGWLGPYNSGEYCEATHEWDFRRTYHIKVKAKDFNDDETPWSENLQVDLSKEKSIIKPYYKFPLLEKILQRLSVLIQE